MNPPTYLDDIPPLIWSHQTSPVREGTVFKNTYNHEDPYGCRSVPHHNELLIYHLYFPIFVVLPSNLLSSTHPRFNSLYPCISSAKFSQVLEIWNFTLDEIPILFLDLPPYGVNIRANFLKGEQTRDCGNSPELPCFRKKM